MRIRALTLRPFRNFDHIHLSFEGDRILIRGPNGRGKSNILEAISFLSIGKSVRGARDQQAVPHGGEYFDIQALCDDGRQEQKLRIFYALRGGKKAFSNEMALPRVSDVLGIFKTVHFSPEDVSLVLRFPAQRRRLLDILIAQSSPQYLRDLQLYQRVLSQRNVLLRDQKRDRSGYHDTQMLEPWTRQLAQLGGRLRKKRLDVIQALNGPFVDYYHRFAADREKAAVEYCGPQGCLEEELVDELEGELTRRKDQERKLGYTLSGPHRDDLAFKIDDQSAEIYASEGQLKTMLIAWKMAEVRFLQQPDENQPVLLLDDVFSALDGQRVAEFLKIIDEFDQVVVTTPQQQEEGIREHFTQIGLPPA